MENKSIRKDMRLYHRYLGFFLAGIMAVYAISGTLMIFRNTDFLKRDVTETKALPVGIKTEELGEKLRIKFFKVTGKEGDMVYFNEGSYNVTTGEAVYTKKELPFILKKMTDMHKATSDRPLFFLNIFFGVSLLFFVVSSFWMFIPKSSIFKKGIYFALAGLLLAVLVIFF